MKALVLSLLIILSMSAAKAGTAAESIPELAPFGPFSIPENEAMVMMDQMGVGWNLGNTFDAFQDPYRGDEMRLESYWNGCMTTDAMFEALSNAGFRSVRIPVSWHNHVDQDFKIREKWLNRVQGVVDYAYHRGMYVILNTHHDVGADYYYPLEQYSATSEKYMTAIWTQIADRFAGYGERLLFESMNEPRMKDTGHEWWIDYNDPQCLEAIECVNKLNQVFVDTVRASGGNNGSRYLMVPGYCASPDGAVNQYFRMPADQAENRIVISVHAYTPYSFALEDGGTSLFSLDNTVQKTEISTFMNSLYKAYVQKGIPVVIGEFGARNKKDNLRSRIDYAAFYTVAARSRNIPCLWWDNGAFKGNGELFGVLGRKQAVFTYPEIVQAMVRYQDCRIK